MDKPVGNKTERSKSAAANRAARPSRAEAEAAVRTLIRWAGDDPDREGLLATPGRVVRAYEEWFAGYKDNPRDYLKPAREAMKKVCIARMTAFGQAGQASKMRAARLI